MEISILGGGVAGVSTAIALKHKGDVLMIGDAVHAPLPTSGQGACQALEDAWHLANCLADSSRDVQQAFSSFTQIRYEKTTAITLTARSLASSLFNQDRDYCAARNEQSKNTDYAKVALGMSQSWGRNLPLNS